jgi:hypothetical protein
VASLNEALNPQGLPYYEAAALHGIGVFETLKGISRLAITSVRKKLAEEPRPPAAPGPPGRPVEDVAARPPSPAPRAAAGDADPLASLLGGPEVEFAAEDTDKHLVPVKTKGQVDIGQELEKLRAMASAPPPPRAAPSAVSKDLEKRLQIHLGFDGEGDEELVRDAVTVTLVGNKRLERLTLHIELDIKGKT